MTGSPDDLTSAAMTELARLLMSTTSFEGLMHSIADLACRAVPVATTCGITLSEDSHVITVASADGTARLLDELQYEIDDGPCLESLRTEKVVHTEDLADETRWSGYPARASAWGVRSVLSNPLVVGGRPIGALNLYATEARAFTTESRSTAAQLTAVTAAIVTATLRDYEQATLTDHLRTALR